MKYKLLYIYVLFCGIAMLYSETLTYPIRNESKPQFDNAGNLQHMSSAVHSEPGEPMLPVKRMKFLLPPETDLQSVSVHFVATSTDTIRGIYSIPPAPLERTEDVIITPDNRSIEDGKDLSIYGDTTFFPKTFLYATQTGKLREYKIVTVTLFTARYNPFCNSVESYSEGELCIRYKTVSNISGKNGNIVPQHTHTLLKTLVANYDDIIDSYRQYPVSRNRNSGYTIITTSAIKAGSKKLNDFIASKRSRGFTVETVTDLGNAEAIRNWLTQNYLSKNIEYVLLIGDPTTGTGDVPMKMTYPWRETPTDFYYSDLSGNWDRNGNGKYGEQGDLGSGGIDLMSEVGVGRIPVYGNDYAILDEILTKTIAYENAPENEIAWRRKLMMAMKGYNAPAEGSRVGEAAKKKISALNSDWSYYRIYDDATGSPELTGVSENFVLYAMSMVETGFVLWMTHGSATDAHSVMSVNGTKQWNKNKQSFVFCGSCLNATPSKSNNLTYSLLKNGSIGAIGGTQTTLFSTGSSMENTGYNSAYMCQFSANLAGKNMHIIDALNTVKASNAPSGNNLQNYMAFTLYGCPAIGIETNSSGVGNTLSESTKSLSKTSLLQVTQKKRTLDISYFLTQKNNIEVALYTPTGQTVQTYASDIKTPGAHTTSLSIESISPGFYFLRLSSHGHSVTQKIVIQ